MTETRAIPWRITSLRRQMLVAFGRRLKPLGLTAQQFQLLWILREGIVQPSAMAERIVSDRPTVSRLLRAMRKAGWVASHRDPADARREVVAMTAAGQALFKRAHKVSDQFRVQLEAPLTPGEVAELHRLLTKLETGITP